jgi:chromosome segregation ATPase
MKPLFSKREVSGPFSYTLLPARLAAAGALLAVITAPAQTTNMAELRELRVACLESFNSAKTRLDELHGFVGQQAERERAAANQLFDLQQSAASAKRRNGELQLQVRQCTNLLGRAQSAVEKATASYRAAVEAMPSGETWAADGSAALNELRRAADAAPRDMWKHKRLKEIEAEFVETLHQWRAARRSMEQASFDLELRAAPSAFRRVPVQIESVSGELKALEGQLAERQTALAKLSKQSKQWGEAIRALREGEAQSREHLASIGFKFHLVDLKFAAWRLKHSGLADEGIEALPDVLEESLASEPARPVQVTGIPGAGIPSAGTHGGAPSPESAAAPKEEAAAVEEGDAAFRDLLARVNLAQARLRFVAEVLQAEFNSVQAAISSLEKVEEQARTLADDTARLAADQESLRRSLETEQQALAKGAETLDLVKKRFAADLKVINQLLDTAAERTATLAKSLER